MWKEKPRIRKVVQKLVSLNPDRYETMYQSDAYKLFCQWLAEIRMNWWEPHKNFKEWVATEI